jgi:hypothetical protein
MKFIFDAGPLITTCKFKVSGQLVIDYVLDHCEIVVAQSVRDEVVVAGARYADAQAARERIVSGRISVLLPTPNPHLMALIAPYNLGQGEQDSILLLGHADLLDAFLVVDDHLAYLVSTRLGQRRQFLLDMIVDLTRMSDLDKDLATQIVEAIRTRYPIAFVEHTLLLLRR